jgi:hypothetical protein
MLKICPECGAGAVPLVWGFPDDGDRRAEAAGLVSLGGCMPPAGPMFPMWACPSHHQWLDDDVAGWQAALPPS